jgi:hypothetical protein
MADTHQAFGGPQAHTFSIVPQRAVFEFAGNQTPIHVARGSPTRLTSVSLIAMAAAPVFDHLIASTGIAYDAHAPIMHEVLPKINTYLAIPKIRP